MSISPDRSCLCMNCGKRWQLTTVAPLCPTCNPLTRKWDYDSVARKNISLLRMVDVARMASIKP